MASNATITVNDGMPTPVAHAFSPVSILDGSAAIYQNKVAASVSARETVVVKMKTNAKVRTVNVDLKVPRAVTEVVNSVSVVTVKDFATAKATLIVPIDWDVQSCENARIILSNLLASAAIGLMVDEAEFVW